ncbi:F-box/FBD/LRR-repeat protein [Spatholobus suberectus]|nr:F-box/FBD/LRR-repeat protein [Spatholobus suberectus]
MKIFVLTAGEHLFHPPPLLTYFDRRRCSAAAKSNSGQDQQITGLSPLSYPLLSTDQRRRGHRVLSRRWRPLCLSLPTFDFDDQSFPTFQHFLHSLYSLFLSRRIDLPLRTFRLKCGHTSPCDPYDINRFVYAAVQRGLRHLHLEMSHTFRIKLPPCVLTCTTLTVLKLKYLILDDDLSDVVFPSLETLHLDWVTFPDHGYLMKLIYACPILEDLKTKDLVVRNGHVWEGELESLPKLLRADISNLDSPFNMLRNAYFLRAELKCAYVSEVPSFPNLTQMELIFEFSSLSGIGL